MPYGAGVMVAGFCSGFLSDKIRPGIMVTCGSTLALVCMVVFTYFDQHTSVGTIYGVLLLAGMGVGALNSSNNMSMMLSVHKDQRGIAAAVSIICLMFTSMLGIVLTFSFVLNSMSQADLFDLFIYGGASLDDQTLRSFIAAINKDWYICIGACALAIVMSLFNDFIPGQKPPVTVSKYQYRKQQQTDSTDIVPQSQQSHDTAGIDLEMQALPQTEHDQAL